MGYDVSRFIDLPKYLEDELTCVICCSIFKEPIVTPCGHAFCKGCVQEWFFRDRSCPVCRKYVNKICKPPIIICNLLGRLRMTCRYHKRGCHDIVSLDNVKSHEESCICAPKPNVFKQFMRAIVPHSLQNVITTTINNYGGPRLHDYDGEDAGDVEGDPREVVALRPEDVFHVSLQTVAVFGIIYNCYNMIRGMA